ncbi:glycerol-3-phosphate dehydrogenase/oxidase [Paraliobacillus sp. PM-2]|uniref:glycerol-3-phosphate dehydrogenase/oxidase n=1 Tax=Paraliobacillus sp. PM-2 TaxID=1462524 RepID=UPI000B83CA58|nr:FAD-dependent oxidoreductase [Paraliobacillus sp. PM-2]
MGFSNIHRDKITEMLSKEIFDVLVIGGGITGAGVALDATARGMKTAVVEMQDFAAGTSSRSTKLIHGGLRYLQHGEVKMVAEVGRERAILFENGPHITKPENMLLPIYQDGTLNKWSTRIGLTMYDRLAGVQKKERHKMLTKKAVLAKEPLVSNKGLIGAGDYIEYKTDDARLTIEVMKKAVQLGATALNYMKVVQFIYDEQRKVIGAEIEDQINGENYTVYANKIVNATGPWLDSVQDLDYSKKDKALFLTKGVHLVFDQSRFPLKQAIYFDHIDGRMIFAIPRENKTYVGTTDTPYHEDTANPSVTKEDCHYLLEAINQIFPSLHLTLVDIESSWAGVRPLITEKGKDPSEISRKDEILYAESGLISIAGGKLTAYRKMAEKVVDKIARQLKHEKGILYSPSETKLIPIAGGEVGGSAGFAEFKQRQLKRANINIDDCVKGLYIDRYGKNVEKIWQNYYSYYQEAQHFEVEPLVFAELIYALEEECIYMPLDFFMRRTGDLFFNLESVERNGAGVLAYLEKKLHWNRDETAYYKRELTLACQKPFYS